MKHIFLILLIITTLLTGIFLPFIHGDYDYFAVGISSTIQFAAFASLLLVPIGLIWCLMDFLKRKSTQESKHPGVFRKFALGVTVVLILAAALGSFAGN